MNVLLVGLGRMGLRHLRGLGGLTGTIVLVDPRPEAEREARAVAAEHGIGATLGFAGKLDDVDLGGIDAAILAETAAGRLERVQALVAGGVRSLLVEKPLEQSRDRLRRLVAAVAGLDARCNHYRRTLPFYESLREAGGPFHIAVTGGAFGLGCNGVHWLDLGAFLTGDDSPRLLFGEIDPVAITSGRGPGFRDYGGRGVFAFQGGSRLLLESVATSSAPTVVAITQPARQAVLEADIDRGVALERDPASRLPVHRYGVDYVRRTIDDFEGVALWDVTRDWLDAVARDESSALPSVAEAAVGHELLFDLLETGGETIFAIT